MTGLPNTGRKAAQRLYDADRCDRCDSTNGVQRHHIDRDPMNNDPSNVEVLCQACHTADHMRDGTWGKGRVEPATCAICGVEFQPKRSRRSTLCGEPECRTEMGRQSAQKRWSQGL